MALWVCAGDNGCGTKYAVGLFRCPRCHNTEFHEDGDPMAKITRHGGASDKTLPATDAAAAETEPTPEAAADHSEAPAAKRVEVDLGDGGGWRDVTEDVASAPTPVADEGGEESSPGNSSSPSTDPQPTNSEPSSKPTRKPARKTASRTAPARTDSSSAPLTATGQTAPTSAADDTK